MPSVASHLLLAAIAFLSVNWTAPAFAQDRQIVVGGKNFTEQLVLAEITTELLKAKGIAAEKQDGLASSLLRQAQENGEVDVYWEYTGTSLVTYNKVTERLSPEEAYERVKALDGEKDLIWLKPSTTNSTYAIAMQAETAASEGIETITDLAEAMNGDAGYKFATDGEFARREDGLIGLQQAYGFSYPRTSLVLMDPGLTYEALRQGRVETAVVLSTDGRVKAFDFAVLLDDKMFFPSYLLAPVVRKDALERVPELEAALNDLSGRFTEERVRELNAQVDVEKKDVRQVAADFLKSEGLVP